MAASSAASVLPVIAPTGAADRTAAPAPIRSARHVAVCDDDVRFIRFVERLLAQAQARICPVTELDPEGAVRVVAEAACDAVMIDLHIYNDERAGLTLVRLFRDHPATRLLPLIMVTGATQRDLKRHDAFLQEHGCALLPKPFGPDALLNALGLAALSPAPA